MKKKLSKKELEIQLNLARSRDLLIDIGRLQSATSTLLWFNIAFLIGNFLIFLTLV